MKIKTYRVTLTAVGPVFVGSGAEYTKTEYINFNNKFVGIVNGPKLYKLMWQKKLAPKFEEFMLGKAGNINKGELDLESWLQKMKLLPQVRKECLSYVLGMGDVVLQQGRPQIKSCLKDSRGVPYIPGSSLKGALRTVLATAKIMERDDWRSEIRQDAQRDIARDARRNMYLAGEAKRAESKIFRTMRRQDTKPDDAVNDTMQGFIVGDSAPIEGDKVLVLAQKIERHKDGTEKRLNLLRESLRPGTKIEFPLTIDEDICPVSAGDLLEAIYNFDEMYSDNFLTKFKDMDRLRADVPQIFLGGGAGFLSKTLVYPVFGQAGVDATMTIFRQTKVPPKHKHNDDKQLGVSPHIVKMTKCDGKTLQMGLCKFEIEEI